MRKAKAVAERRKKHRKRFRVIMEIVFMALGVLCSIMPYPFPLLVPIGIGTIRIISKAVEREKEPEPKQPVIYCNGQQEPHKAKRKTVTGIDGEQKQRSTQKKK